MILLSAIDQQFKNQRSSRDLLATAAAAAAAADLNVRKLQNYRGLIAGTLSLSPIYTHTHARPAQEDWKRETWSCALHGQMALDS